MNTKNKVIKKNKPKEEIFGQRLARIRKEAGYTQRSLATEIGSSHRMIAYYESQGGRPPADFILKVAESLNVTTDQLLGRKSNANKKLKITNQRLLKKFLLLEKLPSRERESIIRIIDGLLKTQPTV